MCGEVLCLKEPLVNIICMLPEQYNPNDAAALMVFQDGHSYVNLEGDFIVPSTGIGGLLIYKWLHH